MLHPDDEQLVLREPSIPGLATLLDDNLACELFRTSFPELGIRHADCNYLRYKPGTNCIASYVLQTLQGPRLVHVTAHSRNAHDKLSKALQDPRCASLRVVVPETALVVSLFPCDDALPALRRLASPESQHELLKHLAPQSESLHSATLSALRYKPKRRFVARLDCDGSPQAILKLHSESEYKHARRAAKTVHSLSEVAPAEALGHSNRNRALLFKWIPGDPLSSWLKSSPPSACDALEEVGRLLAVVHSHARAKLPRGDGAELVKSLKRLPDELRALCPDLAKGLQSLSCQVAKLCKHIERPEVALHGDLNLDQIVVGERVSLIDFDNAVLGHAERDLGNLLAHFSIESLGGAFTQDASEELFESLLKEYSLSGGNFDPEAVRAYAAASLLSMVQEPFRKRLPNWRSRAYDILHQASALIEGDRPLKWVALRPTPQPSVNVHGKALHLAEDVALAAANRATDPREVRAVLLPMLRETYQDDAIEFSSLRVLRHKVGRRCLIEYTCHSPSSGSDFRVLGKISAKPRHHSSLLLQLKLWTSGFHDDSADHISVPRPLGIIDPWQMWLQEEVPGQNCWNELSKSGSSTLAAQIVASLQKLQEARIPSERVHGICDEVELLQDRLSRVAASATGSRKRIQRLAESCRALGESIPARELVATHRDFYPDQVVVAGPRLFLLDFDLYCFSHPALDLGNFCGHLVERGIREPEFARRFAECLVRLADNYGLVGSEQDWKAVEAFATLTLARHVYLCTLYPDRQKFMKSILEACEHRVNSQLQSGAAPLTYVRGSK